MSSQMVAHSAGSDVSIVPAIALASSVLAIVPTGPTSILPQNAVDPNDVIKEMEAAAFGKCSDADAKERPAAAICSDADAKKRPAAAIASIGR